MDEGSGTTLSDAEGNHNGVLNQSTWTSDPAFRGGTAPFFDREDDYGYLDHSNPTEFSVVIRARADADLSGGLNDKFLWSHQLKPGVSYNIDSETWNFWNTADVGKIELPEAQSTVEGSDRIIAYRLSSSQLSANIYDDGGNEIASDVNTNATTGYDANRMYLAWDNDGDRYWGDNLDMLTLANEHLSDSDLDTVLQEEYL